VARRRTEAIRSDRPSCVWRDACVIDFPAGAIAQRNCLVGGSMLIKCWRSRHPDAVLPGLNFLPLGRLEVWDVVGHAGKDRLRQCPVLGWGADASGWCWGRRRLQSTRAYIGAAWVGGGCSPLPGTCCWRPLLGALGPLAEPRWGADQARSGWGPFRNACAAPSCWGLALVAGLTGQRVPRPCWR